MKILAEYFPQGAVGNPLAGARDLLDGSFSGAAKIDTIARQERTAKATNQLFGIDVRCCHGRHSMRS